MAIVVSTAAAAAAPTLTAWLAGSGIVASVEEVVGPARHVTRILDVTERAKATVRDIIVEIVEGAPLLSRAAAGQPTHVRFGFADMAFAHALIAELVRDQGAPAFAEPASLRLFQLAARIARSDATVLLAGETGTGKEGLSRHIHATSGRAGGPFVAVNCAALPETMLEAMLFGHAKGAFTGAGAASEGLFRAADGGTLLLDEIAELPLPLQAKLLRALQEREVLPVGGTRPIAVDVRVIAACNRDLAAEVAAGRFRADLYWRLNVVPLEIEPLRSRRLDVRAIAAALLLRHAPIGADVPWPTQGALTRLMAHDWPGNARELENVLQRALLLHDGDRIEADDLAIDGVAAAPAIAAPVPVTNVTPLFQAERRSGVEAIQAALAATGGHRGRAAAQLGISERTLRYRLAELRTAA